MARRWLLSFLVFLVSVLPGTVPVHRDFGAAAAATETKDCTVYITRTGTKYHQGWCHYLSKSKYPISRREAIKRGYSPCKVCGGSACE